MVAFAGQQAPDAPEFRTIAQLMRIQNPLHLRRCRSQALCAWPVPLWPVGGLSGQVCHIRRCNIFFAKCRKKPQRLPDIYTLVLKKQAHFEETRRSDLLACLSETRRSDLLACLSQAGCGANFLGHPRPDIVTDIAETYFWFGGGACQGYGWGSAQG